MKINIYGKLKEKKYALKRVTAAMLASLTLVTPLTGCFKKDNTDYSSRHYENNIYDDYDNYDNNSNNNGNQNESDYGGWYESWYNNYVNGNGNSPTVHTPSTDETSESKVPTEAPKENDTNNYGNSNNNTQTPYEGDYKEIINSKVSIGSSYNQFSSRIGTLKISYPYSQYYGVSNAMGKYNSSSNYRASSGMNIIKNNRISVDDLYNIVLKNNEQANFPTNKQLSNDELKKICGIMCDVLNDYLKSGNADAALLMEKISNLTIKKYSEMSNGYYDPLTGEMGFNMSQLNKSNDFYRKTVEHETYHFIQASSLNENNSQSYINRMGVCYKFPNLKVNSMYWDWYYEGAAEYLTMNRNNIKTTDTYKNIILGFNMIKLSCGLNPNTSIDTFEKLSLTDDVNDFYSYFNGISKEEVVTMMYAYNIYYSPNSFSTSQDFYNYYAEATGTKMSVEEKMSFERRLANSIAQTQTKLFYNNLAKSISSKTVEVSDIFELIILFEYNTNVQNRYTTAENYKNDYEDFIETYDFVQGEFFQILANKLGVSVDEVYEAYNAYAKKAKLDIKNNSILNGSQKDLYNYIASSKTGYINPINVVSKRINNNQQTR